MVKTLLVVAAALSIAAPTISFAQPGSQRTAQDDGCAPGFHRGVGGTCVHDPRGEPQSRDPNWAPCDYSLPPSVPEGCGD